MMLIFHAVLKAEWQTFSGRTEYTTPSLEKEGFIHCSDKDTVLGVCNANFTTWGDAVLLCIDTSKVQPRIKWEDLGQYGQTYPHIYGALNMDAVVAVYDFPRKEDGSFLLPSALVE